MDLVYNDGGRAKAGYSGKTGDCVCRAIAIATELPYQEVYDALNTLALRERIGKRCRGRSNSRSGVYRKTYDRYLKSLGFRWIACTWIGSGCRVHLRKEELPLGRIICRLSKYLVAVIDGVCHDTAHNSRNGTRCVYGYYTR